MKEIGGYFEIEYSNIELGIHSDAVKLNTGRNCLEYILLAKGYTKIYVPYYTCDVILEPIAKNKIERIFYHINEDLEPITYPILKEKEAFLYTNYFGLKGAFIKKLQRQVRNLIIDNSQALFAPHIPGTDAFYSIRKFIGTPDGAFVYCSEVLDQKLKAASSFERISHLYKRKDVDASFGYEDFKKNDQSLSGLPIMSMSSSTEQFINAYDFAKNKVIRERNFLFLHTKLSSINKLRIDIEHIEGPLCYPLLLNKEGLKENLIKNKVYVPSYWQNVQEWTFQNDCFEQVLFDSLACLPIDHRYTIYDMDMVCNMVLKYQCF
jgi:hypothetical protein